MGSPDSSINNLSVIRSGADRETICEVEKPAVRTSGKPIMLAPLVTHPSKTGKGGATSFWCDLKLGVPAPQFSTLKSSKAGSPRELRLENGPACPADLPPVPTNFLNTK